MPLAIRAVRLEELVEENAGAPAIEDDVVVEHVELEFLIFGLQQRHAHEHVPAQVKGATPVPSLVVGDIGALLARGLEVAEIDVGKIGLPLTQDDLSRQVEVLVHEDRPKNVVPSHHLGEALLHRLHVDLTSEPQRDQLVVDR